MTRISISLAAATMTLTLAEQSSKSMVLNEKAQISMLGPQVMQTLRHGLQQRA